MARAGGGVVVAGVVGISGFLGSHIALMTGALTWSEYCWGVLASLGVYTATLAIGHVAE